MVFEESKLSNNNVTIKWLLPRKKYTGFKISIENKEKICVIEDNDLNKNIEKCVNIGDEIVEGEKRAKVSYTFNNLEPGTEYNLLIKTFRLKSSISDEQNSEIQQLQVLTG